MPKLDLSSISKSINTTVSSVSGGGSTETKRVQNDSSKDAEKELAAVREQMQAERNALREKLKTQIGDGSKMGGNAVAKEMRTGDEGKAIADKYKAMMEPLQKQIDAGISIEVTKKASAIEETTKIANEQLAIIKVSNGTLSNMYKDGSKDKLATAKQDTESRADAEREAAVKTTESIKARLADRQSQVAALEQTATQRELTDKEKSDLATAQSGVRRATNNLKDHETSLLALDQLEKQGLAKTVDAKKSEVAEIGKHVEDAKAKTLDSKKAEVAEVVKQEETKKASVVAQSIFSSMATIGLTDNQKKMYGEFANLSAEDSAKKQASLKEEEASARAANTAASKARDAIEEKAELEGRKMTEAEEAERKALGIIQNSSSDKITAAQEEQKVLSRADEQRVFQAKVQATQAEMQTEVSNRLAEITKNNGLASQESLQKEAEFRLIGVTQGAEAEATAREDSVKLNLAAYASSTTAGKSMKDSMANASEQYKSENKSSGKPGESSQAQAAAKPKEQSETEKLKAEYAKMSKDIEADPKKLQELKGKIDSSEAKEKEQSKPKKGIADMFGDMFAEIKLPDVQKITSTATRINPPEDVAKKTEEDKKAKAAEAKAAEVKKPAEAPKATGEVTLKEVHASLEHLNKSMAQMLTYTQQTATASQQQVKATKNLSGNKFS